MKANQQGDLLLAKMRWYVNADQIAPFLAQANPGWDAADLKAMMRMHLDQTLDEATARFSSDWAADTLSDGISTQFPSLVR